MLEKNCEILPQCKKIQQTRVLNENGRNFLMRQVGRSVKYLVWKIEGNVAKLIMTYAYPSILLVTYFMFVTKCNCLWFIKQLFTGWNFVLCLKEYCREKHGLEYQVSAVDKITSWLQLAVLINTSKYK
jgi:hypothetical protein